MDEILRFFRTYEIMIYVGLGGLALWEIRKFVLAWEELRTAAFGLERESAQTRLNQATVLLVLFLMIAVGEFSLVSFVAPSVPGATPLLTPTIDLLATPTITLAPSAEVTEQITPALTASPLPAGTAGANGCVPGQLEFNSPKNGDTINGKVTLIGSVNYPNLGFYKYEVARPGETIWLTIQAGDQIKKKENLGEWDTRSLTPGDYMLHLVATDNQSNLLGTCQILVHVTAPANP